jgi:hypothetical protein
MLEKTTRSLDSHGRITLMGIYNDAIIEIKAELKKRPELKRRSIGYREFSFVIKNYFIEIFEMLLNGYGFNLYNKMGNIRIVKSKLQRYQPNYYKPDGVNESFTKDYWHFVFWNAPKKWRMYRYKYSEANIGKMMQKVNRGFEYVDLTQDDRKGYIYKVK